MRKSLLILWSSILSLSLILLTKTELQIGDDRTTENISLYDINSGGFSQEKFSDDIHLEKSADAGRCTWAWEKSDDTQIDEKTITVDVTKLITNYDSARLDQITIDSSMELKATDPAAATSDRILQVTMRIGEKEAQQDYGRESKNGDFVEQWAYVSINLEDNKIVSLTVKLVEHAHNGENGNFNSAGKGMATLDFRNLQIHIPKLIFDLTSLNTLKLTKTIVVDKSTIIDFSQLKNEIINLIVENLPNYLSNNDDYTITGLTDYVLEKLINCSNQIQNSVFLQINSLPNSGAIGNCQIEFKLFRKINLAQLEIPDLFLEDTTIEKIHSDIIEYASLQLKKFNLYIDDVKLDLNATKERILILNWNILESETVKHKLLKFYQKIIAL
ncbi:hypothetical protein [Spiroplasma endosymbiont of Labia minor]|uniref:hypothetical protein n=1 Tax=Spiroplasma endosymbiont of Labia minor TaxID=3066305 RepID=UPI0030CD1421